MARTSKWSTLAVLAAFALHVPAFAQSQPKGLQPLPDVPPPPRLSDSPTSDDPDDPTVSIRQTEEGKVEEFRTKEGRVYAIRVTPKFGKPYTLINPDGAAEPGLVQSGAMGNGLLPASWTIFEF